MSNNPEIVVINNTRYRAEDARRLGLVADGKVVTKATEIKSRTTEAPAGLITTQSSGAAPADPAADEQKAQEQAKAASKELVGERPAGNAAKAEWLQFALDNGKTAEELEGLTRDQIAALFASGDE